MAIKTGFIDGLKSFVSTLWNSRNATMQNSISSVKVGETELREIYRTGIGNKILRIKTAYALNDTLQFDSRADKEFYRARLKRPVRMAARWMLAFGRGIVVLHMRGDDLSRPLGRITEQNRNAVILSVFSGDMITPGGVVRDLQSPRYMRPESYIVRGQTVHHSRVVDFTYVDPPELDAPDYRYGGIGEFQLIYEQLIADGIVQRASPRVIDKASTLFYKVRGFKEAMRNKQEADMVAYFNRLEDVRGIMAAGLIDQEDELQVVTQTLTNLADADQITLRRLAMATGIPVAVLIGENVRGLNSTGENERQIFQDTIETLQDEYLDDPINQLAAKLELGPIEFKDNQGETPNVRMDYETKAIDNAVKLQTLGEDYSSYLIEKGVTEKDDFDLVFGGNENGA